MNKPNRIATVKYKELRDFVEMAEKLYEIKSVSIFWIGDELYATLLYQ